MWYLAMMEMTLTEARNEMRRAIGLVAKNKTIVILKHGVRVAVLAPYAPYQAKTEPLTLKPERAPAKRKRSVKRKRKARRR